MSDLVRQLEKAFEWSGDAMLREAADEITALRARLEAVEAERDGWIGAAVAQQKFAKRAEAALATARRDALCECRDIGMEALTGDADGRDIYARIDALFDKDATP